MMISPTENIFSRWLPTYKVVEEFYVSTLTLYNWRKAEVLPFGRLRGKIYYNRSVIEQIVRNKWNVISLFAHSFLSGLMDMKVGLECLCM
ncbi:MAG TPA: hypothetical protein VFI29_00135 [Hanamia sp.]|nr:hypothetical protein [Hanamia sp.]